ncbi:MAG: hypothetical protein U1F43_15495 [Myxococcota bacterium]
MGLAGMKVSSSGVRKKYALRDETKVDLGGGQMVGGGYHDRLREGPAGFLEHAKRVWDANVGAVSAERRLRAR